MSIICISWVTPETLLPAHPPPQPGASLLTSPLSGFSKAGALASASAFAMSLLSPGNAWGVLPACAQLHFGFSLSVPFQEAFPSSGLCVLGPGSPAHLAWVRVTCLFLRSRAVYEGHPMAAERLERALPARMRHAVSAADTVMT